MKRLLAEECQNPKAFRHPTPLSNDVRQYQVFALDDDFVELAVKMRNKPARQINQMRLASHPPYKKTWLEMSAASYLRILDEYLKLQGTYDAHTQEDRELRHPNARMALVIDDCDGLMEVRLIEHDNSTHRVIEWPMAYCISYGETNVKRIHEDGEQLVSIKGKGKIEDQMRLLWGYNKDAVGIGCLKGTACAIVMRHFYQTFGQAKPEFFNNITRELSGITRFAVSILSLLNSVAEIEPETKPSGRIIVGSSTKPHLGRSVVRLRVPKRITNREKYAMSEIRHAARRLHQVRGHYRYLRREPSVPGWERWEQDGEVYFRKWIKPFARGDESLGAVERIATIVRGN